MEFDRPCIVSHGGVGRGHAGFKDREVTFVSDVSLGVRSVRPLIGFKGWSQFSLLLHHVAEVGSDQRPLS